MLTARSNFYSIVLLGFCMLVLQDTYAQRHPLSRVDSSMVITNLNKYQELMGQKDYRSAADAVNKVAMTYWNNNFYEDAIKYYKISLSLNERIFNENGIAMINNNLGMLYSDIEEFQLSLGHFRSTLAARKSNKEVHGIISANINISVVLNNLQRYQESIDALEEALSLAKELEDEDQLRSVYLNLSETYEKMGEVDESIKFFQLYQSFNELVTARKVEKVNEELREERYARTQLENERLRQENEQLKLRQELMQKAQQIEQIDSLNVELAQELDSAQLIQYALRKDKELEEKKVEQQRMENAALEKERRNLLITTAIIVIASLIIISIIVYTVVRTRQHNKLLKQKNEEIEEQNIAVRQLNEEQRVTNIELSANIRELEETKEKLVMSEKMASIGSVVAGIAHEINNSVNFIAGSSELICKIIEGQDEEVKKAMGEDMEIIDELQHTIKQGTKRTNAFISKLRNDNYTLTRFVDSDLVHVIDRAVSTLRHRFEEKNIQVAEDHPKSMEIECIPEHVEQLLINIIDNAVEAVDEGGKIKVKVNEQDGKYKIIVEDDGKGIDPAVLSKIYDPFFTTKEIGKGSGLGLYMAYSYVASHNGKIEVDPDFTDGSRFIITLPKVQETKPVTIEEPSI